MTDYRKVFFTAATNEAKIALGEVTVQWGLLEAMIEVGIWKAMQVTYDVGRSATCQMQILSKMDALQSILHQTHPHLASQFELTANYIRNCLQGRRNTFMHGMWASQNELPGRQYVVKFNARGKLVHVGGSVSVEEINSLASDVADTTNWVMAFLELLPELPKTPDGRGHKTQDPKNPQDCATQKQRALQTPTGPELAQALVHGAQKPELTPPEKEN